MYRSMLCSASRCFFKVPPLPVVVCAWLCFVVLLLPVFLLGHVHDDIPLGVLDLFHIADLWCSYIIIASTFLATSSETLELDNGVRCRMSEICDGPPSSEICSRDVMELLDSVCTTEDGRCPPEVRNLQLSCITDPSERANHVRSAISWTWKGYRDCAAGEDELKPVSCSQAHWLNLTLTAVDGLDTLLLAGLESEFKEALDIVKKNLNPRTSGDCNLFETTIRIVGGLISAYHLVQPKNENASRYLLEQAVDIGARLARGFVCRGDGCTGIPYSDVNLSTGSTSGSVALSSLSEFATLSVEFTSLARLTGHREFELAALRVHDVLTSAVRRGRGLLPQFFSTNSEYNGFDTSYIMMGARTDSYYEYLLKQWILTGRKDNFLLKRFIQAMQSMRARLIRSTGITIPEEGGDNLMYVAEESQGQQIPKMDHLVCFLPGVLALADYYNVSTVRSPHDVSDLNLAIKLASTCYKLYQLSPSGLAPEIVHFIDTKDFDARYSYPGGHVPDVGDGHFYINEADAHSLLRPETVESLFILWKVTGDPMYRDWSWSIFRAFERWARVSEMDLCIHRHFHDVPAFVTWIAAEARRKAPKLLQNKYFADVLMKGSVDLDGSLTGIHMQHMTARSLLEMEPWRKMVHLATEVVDAGIRVLKSIRMLGTGMVNKTSYQINHSNSVKESWNFLGRHWDELQCPPSARGGGYSSLSSVIVLPPPKSDKMESFWLSETLKYLYLIFIEEPDRCVHHSCQQVAYDSNHGKGGKSSLSLDQWVFNTEAHPLPIVGPINDSLIKPVDWLEGRFLFPYNFTDG